MKYSRLRLLIAVTLVCVLLGVVMGRIEYLRRWAVFHERAADSEDIGFVVGDDAKGYRLLHDVKAEEYRAAMWRPWTIVEEPSP
jgi:hypothetical protein